MDPLSELLSILRLRSYVAGGFDHGGHWSIRIGRYEGVKCYAVTSGQCWLKIEGQSKAIHLQTGDCFLLPRGLPFILASALDVPSVAFDFLKAKPKIGGVRIWNGGGDCFLLGGYFGFAGSHGQSILNDLPPVVHIRAKADKARLQWCLEQMLQELRDQKLGGALIIQQLATSLLTQALRLHLEVEHSHEIGWLRAMADAQLKAAVTAMHQDPGRSWTLQRLGQCSCMSRSTFAQRFKMVVGMSAMEYLLRWRMLLAGHRLLTTEDSISGISFSLGYESEASFRTAFRKVMACSPKQYRQGQKANDSDHLASAE